MSSNIATSTVPDAGNWDKNPHGFSLGNKVFLNFLEAMAYGAEPDLKDASVNKQSIQEKAIKMFIDLDPDVNGLPTHFIKPNATDTSVGGNDAINALWQFNIDDDIIHPMLSSDNGECKRGLGRVYNETYQNNYHMMWMSFGVPHFSGTLEFLQESSDTDTAKLMNNGDLSIIAKIGSLLKSVPGLAFKLPGMAVQYLLAVEDRPITKYYALRPTMPLYYRMVNVILSQLAVNMGMYPVDFLNKANDPVEAFKLVNENLDMLPEVLHNGPDIFSMMDKRRHRVAKYDGRQNDQVKTLEAVETDIGNAPNFMQRVKDYAVGIKNTHSKFMDNFGRMMPESVTKYSAYAFDLTNWVGFRIEKGTDMSETVSNSTGESDIASSINSKIGASRENVFKVSAGSTDSAGGQVLNMFKDAISSITDSIGLGAVTNIAFGDGYVDIPEVWKSSSFSKNFSFSIQLRAKYGDPVSIYQSIYVPLAMLLAAALPRAIGKNAYTSPFILEAYSKGLFATPLGIIESMTIKRGLPEFGWTHAHLPTAVDVDVVIKDLSPAFFISIAGEHVMHAFQGNSSMDEYINVLSGLSIRERTFARERLQRRLASLVLIQKNTTFNPLYWANVAGSNSLVRFVSNTIPRWVTPDD